MRVRQVGQFMLTEYQELLAGTPTRQLNEAYKIEYWFDNFSSRSRLFYASVLGAPDNYRIKLVCNNSYLMTTVFGFRTDPVTSIAREPPIYSYTLPLESEKPGSLEVLSSMFVYSNLVKYQMVGDTEAPLLGIVPITAQPMRSLYGTAHQYYAFSPPYYIPVLRTQFDTIEIPMNTDWGAQFPFSDDPSTSNKAFCRLHFRKRKAAGRGGLLI